MTSPQKYMLKPSLYIDCQLLLNLTVLKSQAFKYNVYVWYYSLYLRWKNEYKFLHFENTLIKLDMVKWIDSDRKDRQSIPVGVVILYVCEHK